jgi:predicted dienelactone hydrolase
MTLLFLLLACSPDPDTAAPADTAIEDSALEDTGLPDLLAPDQPGPWAVGSWDETITGPDGVDLTVQVWYPAFEAGPELYPYLYGYTAQATTSAPAACETPRPVLVFSHGNAGMRYHTLYLAERMASRGWVVVAPDHTFGAAVDYDEGRFAEVLFRRPLDLAASFDWLVERAVAAGGALEGCVDPGAGYAVAGHSLGGMTAAATAGAVVDPEAVAERCDRGGGWLCEPVAAWAAAHPGETPDLDDPRAWAAVLLAPGGYEAVVGGLQRALVPLLTLGGSADTTTSMDVQVGPYHEHWGGTPRYLGELIDAGHHSFSMACPFEWDYPECGEPYLEAERAHAIVNTTTAAFLGLVAGDGRHAAWLPPEDDQLDWEAVD